MGSESAVRRAYAPMTRCSAFSWRMKDRSSGRKGYLHCLKGPQRVEATKVGDDRREQDLELGLAPAAISGLSSAEVLEVVDLSFDDRASSELCLDRGPLFILPRLGKPRLVKVQGDGAGTGALDAFAADRTRRARLGVENQHERPPALVVPCRVRVGGHLAGGAGRGQKLGVDEKIGLGIPPRVERRPNLGDHLGSGLLHRLPGVAVAVGHVADDLVDCDARLLRLLYQRRSVVPVLAVSCTDVDTQDDLGRLFFEDVSLVAVIASGGGLSSVAHLWVRVRHDAVLGGALLDTRFAGVGVDLDVLGDDGTEQLRRLLGFGAALD